MVGALLSVPDGMLYVSVGDTGEGELAQDPKRLEGLYSALTIPMAAYLATTPFPDPRSLPSVCAMSSASPSNPETGFLYATDNGPGGFDEVNKIEAGFDYGWPGHMGVGQPGRLYSIQLQSTANWPETPIGPTGVTFSPEQPRLAAVLRLSRLLPARCAIERSRLRNCGKHDRTIEQLRTST